MTRFRALLAALAVGALLAACGGETTETTAPTPVVTADPTAAATDEPTAEPTDGAALPSFELPSSDAELEALLPDTIGGVEIQKFSMRGGEFMTSGDDNQEFVDFLNRMNAQPDDVSVAFGFGFSADFEDTAAIFAFRVAGAPTSELVDELQASLEEDSTETLDWAPANVGGKSVLRAQADSEEFQGFVYLYGVGDIVFFLNTSDEDAAAEVLSSLP